MARILVAEDNAMSRDMIVRRLERAGYTILTAEDGVEAVEKVEAELPDLVLMDMGLPRLNGFRATRQLKRNPATAAIPVIALTAFNMEGEREKCLSVGCDEYESKPVDFPSLLTKITTLLER